MNHYFHNYYIHHSIVQIKARITGNYIMELQILRNILDLIIVLCYI
jgi:hypothetical protein